MLQQIHVQTIFPKFSSKKGSQSVAERQKYPPGCRKIRHKELNVLSIKVYWLNSKINYLPI